MDHSIMIMCEHNDGRLLPVTDELLACAAGSAAFIIPASPPYCGKYS
jgi:hypothetical protein